VSVGAVTRAQLDILLRRLRRSFPSSHLVIGYWDSPNERRSEDEETKGIRYADTVSALVDFIGREADERDRPAQPVRYLDTAANA
jgi:hypothetical protein